jgi:predicted NBD/HSP70 family sugar kinase
VVIAELGQRSETVRRANLGAIVRELHVRGPSSRSQLVARTGLTRSAIRSLIGELSAAGIASEERARGIGTPGRPSPVVRLNARSRTALALEISVDSLAAAMVGLGGEVLAERRTDRPRGHSTVDAIAGDLARLTRTVRRDARAAVEIGTGVAIVGLVRPADGIVSVAPNLGWLDVPVAERLACAVSSAGPVTIANDADVGALAELRRGAARGADNVLYVSGEVGVGGGLIVDGRLMAGASGYAGEVGHMPVNPEGRPCRCGSRGCWETEIGERALLAAAGHDPDGGRVAREAVLDAATAGGERALEAMDQVGRWLGIGLALLVNVLNPRLIVLGGLLGRIHPFVERRVREAIEQYALPASRELLRIVPAALGASAPLVGAGELALEPLLIDPAAWLAPTSTAQSATA